MYQRENLVFSLPIHLPKTIIKAESDTFFKSLKASVKALEINQDNQELRGKDPTEKRGRLR